MIEEGRDNQTCLDCQDDLLAGFLPAYELKRPISQEIAPDGKRFLVEGTYWHYRFDAVTGQWRACKKDEKGQHGGPDLQAPYGTEQIAPSAGRLLKAGWQDPNDHTKGWGLHVRIECSRPIIGSKGFQILPWLTGAHYSELYESIKEGDYVALGQPIGKSGNSGNVSRRPGDPRSGAHAHWQLEEPGDWPRRPIRIKWVT